MFDGIGLFLFLLAVGVWSLVFARQLWTGSPRWLQMLDSGGIPPPAVKVAQSHLDRIAFERGMTLTRSSENQCKLEGMIGGLRAHLTVGLPQHDRFGHWWHQLFVVDASDLVGDGISIAERVIPQRKIRGVDTGDQRFDRRFLVKGPAVDVAAMLNERLRNDLLGFPGMIEVRNGRIFLFAGVAPVELGRLLDTVEAMVGAIRTRPLTPSVALLANVTEDDHPSVRGKSLRLLITRLDDTIEAQRAKAEAIGDPNAGVRLLAAAAMGPEGFSEIEEIVLNPLTRRDVRRDAVRFLAENHPDELVRLIDEKLVVGKVEASLLELVNEFGRIRFSKAVKFLCDLSSHDDLMCVYSATRALRRIADPAAEQTLVRLLSHGVDRIKLEAIRGLERVGSVHSLPALLHHTRGLFVGASLREAGRQAVEQIRRRAGDIGPGQLAILDDQQSPGSLSAPPDFSGSVSMVNDSEELEEEDGDRVELVPEATFLEQTDPDQL